MIISKIQNANRYKSLHGGGYQIGVGINKTSTTHHIGYYPITNDVTKPHQICTEHKDDITNNKSHMSQPHQMNGQIITDLTSNIK